MSSLFAPFVGSAAAASALKSGLAVVVQCGARLAERLAFMQALPVPENGILA